jgi:peptide/nickel transport system substrate-binding protein
VTRKPLLLTAAAVLAAGTLAACGSGGTSSSGTAFDPKTCQGGTLEVLNQRDLGHFDPARLYTSGGGKIPTLLFRTLTTRNRVAGSDGTKVVPDLATTTGEPSDGAKTWTYHLRDGLKFDDGTPITSADIKYGIERSFSADLPGGAAYLHDWLVGAASYPGPYQDKAGLSAIGTPDAKTIVFHLKSPHGDFPYLASATQFAPVPKAKDTGTSYENHPVSSGPYKIESYQKSSGMVLVRNPNWSRKVDDLRLACPDKVDIKWGLSAAVINQRIAASAGEDANAITTDTQLGPAQIAQLNTNKQLASHVSRAEFASTTYLTYNVNKAPFSNIKVREALSYAVNRQSVINAIGGSSLGYPATTFLPDQKAFGYQKYDYFPAGTSGNPKKAKQALADAGYPNGLSVTLAHNNQAGDPSGPEVATAIQDALRKAGFTVKLQSIDVDSYSTQVDNPATQPQLAISGWGADWPAGGPFLVPIFDGRQIIAGGGNFNNAQFNDPKINAEIDQINTITDPAQAAQKWGELDAELGKLALYVPLYHEKDLWLYGKNVKNAWSSEWNGIYDPSQVSVK